MLVKREILPINYLNSLWIKEKYPLYQNSSTSLSEKEYKAWRNRKNIVSDESFSLMLSEWNYEEEIFSNCLMRNEEDKTGEICEYLLKAEWFQLYKEAIELVEVNNTKYDSNLGFSYILRPFTLFLGNKLSKFIESKDVFRYFDLDTLMAGFIDSLGQIAHKSLVLELNVSRLRNELTGTSSEERFHSFNERFYDLDILIAFYEEYQVLSRILATKTLFFYKNTIEFIDRFLLHKEEIYSKFNLSSNDFIKTITFGEGDSHQQGRNVFRIEFESTKHLFYKPRNTDIGNAYQDYLNWINQYEDVLEMATYRILGYKDYSFEEIVEKKGCDSEEEVRNFYIRFGQLLAIVYSLNGTDMHMENIIASGSNPIIVDFETLLHNSILFNWSDSAYVNASYEAQELVSSTMLLPIEIKENLLNDSGIDMSGLNGKSQKLPYKVPGPININSDEMKYGLIEWTTKGANNLPELNGQPIDYTNYIEEIIKGFKVVYSVILANRDSLLKETKVLSNFNKLKVRIIPRGTTQYFNMINNTYHPDYLRHALDREQVIENIWSVPYQAKSIIKSEYEDLLNDDIPIFFNYTNSKDLIDSTGKIYRDVYKSTGYSLLLDKINKMNAEDMEKQVSVIVVKTGMYEKLIQNEEKKGKSCTIKDSIKKVDVNNIDNDIFVNEAKAIGDHILSKAIYSENGETVSWLGINVVKDSFDITPITSDFYDGLSGLFHFYYYLHQITKEDRYEDIYRKLLNSAEERMVVLDDYSIFTGQLSLLYPLAKISYQIKGDSKWKDRLLKLLKLGEDNLDNFIGYDWMSGTTGFLHCVINIFEESKDPEILALCIKLANKLIRQLDSTDRLLGGFAHGSSSVAYVLIRLGTITKSKKFLEKGKSLLEFDQSLFSEGCNGWLDISTDDNICRHQWCHGTEGIGISRLLISQFINDERTNTEIEKALDITLNSPYKSDDCLCHGNMGTTELFLHASQIKNDKSYETIAKSLALKVIQESKERGSYKDRSIPGFRSVGMFTGIAGIGYQLLRIANPESVPSVLSFN
ncbi:type 2 lantipeptide synthetase LanM [Pradoshia sp. D12]|uniref:type 2 lanthipeptide synthetase LanM family protein n=1 Tax=Bacillaceae TaxID=186817 RepID=UPI00112D188E|nr:MULTISPECIES: type 2 lanthipeptide synthetase LanM family protein [Bacillaceae]QFK72955.1 type 2 lantipeptide synthetase LanM [Pradoshia sp. D12]TPF71947.1 type 2 lantipeptide synthetase LanM [Bacillus sp. D12]